MCGLDSQVKAMKITIHDAEHWITVHPNGNKEDKGQPLLIEGSNGHYVVKGGAGGKLNGMQVSPKSMSKARGGSEGGNQQNQAPTETKKNHVVLTKNHKTGTVLAHIPASGISPVEFPTEGHATEFKKGLENASDPSKFVEEWKNQQQGNQQQAANASEQGNRTLNENDCQLLLRNKRLDSAVIGDIMNRLKSGEKAFDPHRDENGQPHWSREQLGKAYRDVINGEGNTAAKTDPADVQNVGLNAATGMMQAAGLEGEGAAHARSLLQTHPMFAPALGKPVRAAGGARPQSWSENQIKKAIEQAKAKFPAQKTDPADEFNQNLTVAQITENLHKDGMLPSVVEQVVDMLKSGHPMFEPKVVQVGGGYVTKHWSKYQINAAIRKVKAGEKSNGSLSPAQIAQNKAEEERRKQKEERQKATSKADELSAAAKTIEEHKNAMEAHRIAYNMYSKGIHGTEINHHATKFHEHRKEVARLQKLEAKNKPRVKKEAPAGRSFAKSTPKEVQAHFSENYGLNVFSETLSETEALRSRYLNEQDPEKRKQYYQEYAQAENDKPRIARSVTPIDITANTPNAKKARQMLTNVDNAMKGLQEKGFDIKGALAKANVTFVVGNVKKHNGVAWGGGMMGAGRKGYFAVSLTRRLHNDEEQAANNKARMDAGVARWSVSASSENQSRATIVHEMAHALGLRDGVESPRKLGEILSRMHPSYPERMRWIKENISEYATDNIKETDAELAAMVTDPAYKWGTLPKELEDHVKELFNYKGK